MLHKLKSSVIETASYDPVKMLGSGSASGLCQIRMVYDND